MRITAYAATDVGRHREGNEDSMFSGRTVFAVADGMGGHQAGEVASAAALEPIAELDGMTFDDERAATEALRAAIESANSNVVGQAKADPNLSGMGTTLTAVMVRDGRLHLAHVGDSRAYLLRDAERIDQLTTDHTLVEQLVRDGRLSREEIATHPQRSVITRAIGVDATIEVDTFAPLMLQPGDQILLCSDGLTGPVSDEQLTELLVSEPDGDDAVRQLIQAANDAGGPDNITVVLLRVEDDGEDAAAPATAPGGETPVGGTAPAAVDVPPKSIQIRTRPESDQHQDWARDMGRYADRQGVEGTGPERRGRGRRILGMLTGMLIILGILVGGGYLLLSRAYFIGEAEGTVRIFNGLPETVAGVELYREVDDSGLPVDTLPAHLQERVRDGITVQSVSDAERIIDGYRSESEDSQTQAGSGRQPPESTPAP
ncbi:MAG: Stp1/IreP family PP2C-type Ser/Thr phosphatase [Nitriliruptorales bacterium]|nr:Stp1/IreP family PP2C-type Ser/Thr phosphatase [Nitriliruptorales bacterium]